MNIYQNIYEAIESGHELVVISVLKTSGPTPAKTTFKMIVFADGKIVGTVGGGEIEKKAQNEAQLVFKSRTSQLKEYDLDELKMECGGSITLFYEYIPSSKQIVIFGGGHVGRALYRLAKLISIPVNVYDDREEIIKSFPAEDSSMCDFRNIPIEQLPQQNGYIIVVTYGHNFDYLILKQLIKSDKEFRYIGVIGSKLKISGYHKRLLRDGLQVPANLFAPIGINIGAETADEIAVAIMAEIIAVDKNVTTDSMRKMLKKVK